MSTPTREEFTQARATLDTISAKAKADPTYMSNLKADPRGTLQAAGLSDGAIDDVLREENTGDVSGYMRCWFTCMTTDSCGLTINVG
jgi:hypothetical protein